MTHISSLLPLLLASLAGAGAGHTPRSKPFDNRFARKARDNYENCPTVKRRIRTLERYRRTRVYLKPTIPPTKRKKTTEDAS